MDTIGPWELLIIVVAVGLLFGANLLPQMARSLGERIREFRHALHEGSQPSNPPATQVLCCDSSKNKHASRHARQHAPTHQIARSMQPGEDWLWCYTDQTLVRAPTGGPAR
jgi:TatA/E family protein of Tat protein translocase